MCWDITANNNNTHNNNVVNIRDILVSLPLRLLHRASSPPLLLQLPVLLVNAVGGACATCLLYCKYLFVVSRIATPSPLHCRIRDEVTVQDNLYILT